MPRLDLAYKTQKVLKFLLAFLDPRVVGLLAPRGLTHATRKEAWDLLVAAGGGHLDVPGALADDDGPREQLARVRAYEREWFDVVSAALAHHHPALQQGVLVDLRRAHDADVVLRLMTWLERIEALAARGDEGAAAVALLARRGFTPAERARGRALLAGVMSAPTGPRPPEPDVAALAARQRAEDELWAWYQDWSRTARAVVKRKDLRIKLGLSSPAHGDAEPDAPPA